MLYIISSKKDRIEDNVRKSKVFKEHFQHLRAVPTDIKTPKEPPA